MSFFRRFACAYMYCNFVRLVCACVVSHQTDAFVGTFQSRRQRCAQPAQRCTTNRAHGSEAETLRYFIFCCILSIVLCIATYSPCSFPSFLPSFCPSFLLPSFGDLGLQKQATEGDNLSSRPVRLCNYLVSVCMQNIACSFA